MDYEPNKGEKAAIYGVLGLLTSFGIVVVLLVGLERIENSNEPLSIIINIIKYGVLLVGVLGGFWLLVKYYAKGDDRDN